jgi:hypothetical protein
MDTFSKPSNWNEHKNEKSPHLWKICKSWQKMDTNQTKTMKIQIGNL